MKQKKVVTTSQELTSKSTNFEMTDTLPVYHCKGQFMIACIIETIGHIQRHLSVFKKNRINVKVIPHI